MVGRVDENQGQEAWAVVAQWTYNAHGTPISREDAFLDEAHGLIPPIGHQGLFGFDPGRPMEQTPGNVLGQSDLRPWKQTLYHNRARTYSPGQGRFLQRDPNGLGVPVNAGIAFGGTQTRPTLEYPNLIKQFGDGFDTYSYAAANPISRGDPTGLFIGGILGGLGGLSGSMEIQSDYNDEVMDAGGTIIGVLRGLFANVAAGQADMADWAGDWSRSDDEMPTSYKAAGERMAQIEAENNALLEMLFGGEGGPLMAGSQKHHLIPKFLNGFKKGQLMAMDDVHHKMFHAMLNKELKKNWGKIDNAGGTKYWIPQYKADPSRVRDAFYRATTRFDKATGGHYGLTNAARREAQRQGW